MAAAVDIILGVFFGAIFLTSTVLTVLLLARQLFLTIFVRYTSRRNPYRNLRLQDWPLVTILIPAHNEELVLAGCLASMAALDYPAERLEIIVINDRSRDRTGAIADSYAERYPQIRAHHRAQDAMPGKPAAIKEVIETLASEVIVFFDADYLPAPGLLKELVAPFIDPEVGATMGRVVPYNTNANMLTKLIDLERRAGYGVDQFGRSLLSLLPQFGGTVGGIRLAALRAVGGWRSDVLAEDTDLTYRLFVAGWSVEYLNHAVCYEESPEDWGVRFRQVRRWAFGHNQCFYRYFLPVLRARNHSLVKRLDAAAVLLFYFHPIVSFFCLYSALVYPLLYSYPPLNLTVVPALALFVAFGNFAPYFQVIVAAQKDRQISSIRLLPLIFVSSTVSMLASVSAFWSAVSHAIRMTSFQWDKTTRFRSNA